MGGVRLLSALKIFRVLRKEKFTSVSPSTRLESISEKWSVLAIPVQINIAPRESDKSSFSELNRWIIRISTNPVIMPSKIPPEISYNGFNRSFAKERCFVGNIRILAHAHAKA